MVLRYWSWQMSAYICFVNKWCKIVSCLQVCTLITYHLLTRNLRTLHRWVIGRIPSNMVCLQWKLCNRYLLLLLNQQVVIKLVAVLNNVQWLIKISVNTVHSQNGIGLIFKTNMESVKNWLLFNSLSHLHLNQIQIRLIYINEQ